FVPMFYFSFSSILFYPYFTCLFLLSRPLFFFICPRSSSSTLFLYTTLFRSLRRLPRRPPPHPPAGDDHPGPVRDGAGLLALPARSEEHTSELQSREKLVCRLLLEKKKKSKKR